MTENESTGRAIAAHAFRLAADFSVNGPTWCPRAARRLPLVVVSGLVRGLVAVGWRPAR